MADRLNRLLFALATLTVGVDSLWLIAGHFRIDARAYVLLALLAPPLVAASAWYRRVRGEPAISAALAVAAFVIVFPAAASLLSYLLVTVAGPRIDAQLAAADRMLGFDWPSLMAWAADHPLLNDLLSYAYVSVMPQTLVLFLALGWRGDLAGLYGLTLAAAFGALLTLGIWTAAPSFGAFSVFTLPDAVASRLGLVLGFDYAHDLVMMLKNGPGVISPREIRGIVGFPSYHTLQALTLAWYARHVPIWRWAALALNAAVLVAIPIQGGHHLVDMLGGLAVTVMAVALAQRAVKWAARPGAGQPKDRAVLNDRETAAGPVSAR